MTRSYEICDRLLNLNAADILKKPCSYGLIKPDGIFFKTGSVDIELGSRDKERVARWFKLYGKSRGISLSDGQAAAIKGIVSERFSILTGGPGCGKTTATLVLVKLLEAMKLKVLLAAPTGRAAQRMMDVIGREAKTIHRLLEWQIGSFKKNEKNPLDVEFLIVEECSMLDINLTASLLKAVPHYSQVLFIGDTDQVPSVSAGNVLRDMIAAGKIPCYRLTEVFRQAKESLIIRYAHQINKGDRPYIDAPFEKPEIWKDGTDCLFFNSDEATREQLGFIGRVKKISGTENRQTRKRVKFKPVRIQSK